MTIYYIDPEWGDDGARDISPQARTSFTMTSGAVLSTAQAKFGAASLSLPTVNSVASLPDDTEFSIGAKPFTVEAWVYVTAAAVSAEIQTILCQGATTQTAWSLRYKAGVLEFNYTTDGSTVVTLSGAYTPTANTWVWIAADRDAANDLRIYADTAVIATTAAAVTFWDSTGVVAIGNAAAGAARVPGYMQDVRITIGAARYAGTPVVPTGPLPSTARADPYRGFVQLHGPFTGSGGGASFADRWRTLGSGALANRIVPGDTIRIIASEDPSSPASATWTDNSGTVSWAANKNLVIDNCDTNWTAKTNITCASTTTTRKEGSACQSFTPVAAFTTGVMGYRTLPSPLDLSEFQGVSFWHQGNTGVALVPGALELWLCSDTLGASPVHKIPLEVGASGIWTVSHWDNGAALNYSIQSIALSTNVDPSTSAVRLDNIVACKASTSVDFVCHKHAIGKNTEAEPEWYSILSIAADSVLLGGHYAINLGSTSTILPRPYRGTTESVATYVLHGLDLWGSAYAAMNESGTRTAPYLVSGGWDRTDMSTQSGQSYFQGRHAYSYAIGISGQSWVNLEKIGGINLTTAPILLSTVAQCVIATEQTVGCYSGPTTGDAREQGFHLSFTYMQGGAGTAEFGLGADGLNDQTIIRGKRIHGSACSASTPAFFPYSNTHYFIDRIDNNAGYGISNAVAGYGSFCDFYNTVFENNATCDIFMEGTAGGAIRLQAATFTPYAAGIDFAKATGGIYSTRHGGTATDHRIYHANYTLLSSTSVRHTDAGIAWQLLSIDAYNNVPWTPAFFSLAKIACNSSALVTVKCWLRRDNTALHCGIRLVPSDIAGDPEVFTQTLMSAAADTWQEITLTFTPTGAGVVEIIGIAYTDATTYSAWFDDLTVTQD